MKVGGGPMGEDDGEEVAKAKSRAKVDFDEDSDEVPRDHRTSRLYRLGRKLLDRGDDVRDLASTVIETSDRAKSEMVRMVAREVRNYLDELKLKEDLMDLARSHSLEIGLSLRLKPLAPEPEKKEEPE